MSLRVLIACEASGIVREAFRRRGFDAWSCDLRPSEQPGQHYQCDFAYLLPQHWDFVGFHTDCTFMCNSGVRWLHTEQGRWGKLDDACKTFNMALRYPRPGYLENPIPHKYAVERIGRTYDQIIQPWQFGHGETKATCLWLKDVPPLTPSNIVAGREPRVHHASPGPNRWIERSRTLAGIADAMAQQWGDWLMQNSKRGAA